jgi:hypothetical protein
MECLHWKRVVNPLGWWGERLDESLACGSCSVGGARFLEIFRLLNNTVRGHRSSHHYHIQFHRQISRHHPNTQPEPQHNLTQLTSPQHPRKTRPKGPHPFKMGKRTKQYKKLMRSFEQLGFRQPYQLLMTSDVVLDTTKLDLVALFEKTLSTKGVKPMITQCCIVSLQARNFGCEVWLREREREVLICL